jgi:hypothetical protein
MGGYTFALLTTGAPTEAEGRTADGRPYLFHARHGDWDIELGNKDWPTDYAQWPTEWHELHHVDRLYASGADPSMGYMTDDAIRAILTKYLPA